jgi:deoxyribose-phosphate aldolase
VRGLKEEQSEVKVCSVVGFPHGNIPIKWKLDQASYLINKGVHEIDWVLNCADVFEENWFSVSSEMTQMATLCRDNGVVSKCIIEAGTIVSNRLLTELFNWVRETSVNYIKTSTGFNGPGANLEHIKLWAKLRDDAVYPKIKASGGIKTPEQAVALIEAGADRLGMSASVDVYEKWLKGQGDGNV